MRGWLLAVLLAVVIGSAHAATLNVVAPDVVEIGQPIFISATGNGTLAIWRDGIQVAGGQDVVLLQENATAQGTITYVVSDDSETQTVQVTVLSSNVQTVYIGGLPFQIVTGGDAGQQQTTDAQGIDPGALQGPVFQSGGAYASQQLDQLQMEGYMSTYQKDDLPLIVEDGIGTLLAAIVENIPLIIIFVVFYLGATVISRSK